MVPFQAKINENIIYFSHNLYKILMLWQLMNFFVTIKLSSDLHQRIVIVEKHQRPMLTVFGLILPERQECIYWQNIHNLQHAVK